MLENSPNIFGVGTLKNDLFKSFMAKNVGVSHGCPWKRRRLLNEQVLTTDKLPADAQLYHREIAKTVQESKLPTDFDDFFRIAKKMTFKIVFNEDKILDEVFDMFSEANSLSALVFGSTRINPGIEKKYWDFMKNQLKNPKPNSLTKLAVDRIKQIPFCPEEKVTIENLDEWIETDLLHQIPHWIFPTVSAFAINLPRFMTILLNHPDKYQKLLNEIKSLDDLNDPEQFHKLPFFRNCILEALRLNNPVITTFRTLLQDYYFSETEQFGKYTTFLVLNGPILREPSFFKEPNKFIPERWSPEMENSFFALMFNQGPQRCPGKELAIFLMQSTFINLIQLTTHITPLKINTESIPQMLNPFSLKFKYD